MEDLLGLDGLSSVPGMAGWSVALLEQVPVAATLRRADSRLVWANEAYVHLVGRPLADLLGSTPLALEDEELKRYLAGVIRSDGSQSHAEMAYVRDDGSQMVVEIEHHLLRSDDGVLRYFFSYLTDVTAREDLARRVELGELISSVGARCVELNEDDLGSGISAILDEVCDHFDAALVQVWDRAAGADSMREAYRHATGLADRSPGLEADWETYRRAARWSNLDQDAVTIENLSEVPVRQQELTQALAGEGLSEVGSFVAVPLWHGADNVSVLVVYTALPRQWSSDKVTALRSVLSALCGVRYRVRDAAYFAAAFDRSPVGVTIRDDSLKLLEANTAYADFLGYDAEVLPDIDAGVPMVIPEEAEDQRELADRILSDGFIDAHQIRYRHSSGATVLGRLRATMVSDIDGGGRYVLSYVEDITESEARAEALGRSEERLRSIVENSPAIIFLVDRQRTITFINQAIEDLGIEAQELTGRSLSEIDWEPMRRLDAAVQEVLVTGHESRFHLETETPRGFRWLEVSAVPELATGGEVTGVILLAQDDTDRRLSEMELEHQARYDELTGLHNRLALLEMLEAALHERPEPTGAAAAVLFLDLDRFKLVNDSLGHSAGDALLMEVAERLRRSVRRIDVVSRLGGDEFVLMLQGPVSQQDAVRAARRIQEVMLEPLDLLGQEVFVTLSIGIAFLQPGGQIEDVLRHADAAMYEAKDLGRNRFEIFDDELEERVNARVQLESAMRRAVPNGELELYFQPEVDIASREIRGIEALLRWHHPDLGLISAGEFVGLAEETGLIVEIGEWVLAEACSIAGSWARDPSIPDIDVRVNLSARQIAYPKIVSQVTRAMESAGLDSSRLCLEITETAFMHEPDKAMETLDRFRALGIRLAVDDFGTGWASLTYVKQFPVNVLKIDRSFVEGVAQDAEDAAIVRSQVDLAQAMGLDVVAEGVERDDQAEALLALGVQRAQGYLYGRPQPQAIAENLLRAGRVPAGPSESSASESSASESSASESSVTGGPV